MKESVYENTEVKVMGGGRKIVRKVTIKNGKGYKSVTRYHKGRKVSSVRKPIHKDHVDLIVLGKFIPGLFSDCGCNKTRRKRGGNNDNFIDLEKGPNTDNNQYMTHVPPDPERFKRLQQKTVEKQIMNPSSPEEAAKIYSGPTPSEIQERERKQMADEDPLNMDPFIRDAEDFKLFSEGGKTRRRRNRKH